jgi:two-component system sensor histidine kinase KdpD
MRSLTFPFWKRLSCDTEGDRRGAGVYILVMAGFFARRSGAWRQSALQMDAVRRELRGVVIALLLVAATTVIAWALIRYLDLRRGSVIYLLPVMLAGWRLGLLPALVAAVAGVLWSGYFFYSPFYTYYLARPSEIVNLVLFMIVALVTSHLANSMKRQTELARKQENEVSDLYAFSRKLAAAPSATDIYRGIEEHLARLVQRKVVLFGAEGSGDATANEAAMPKPVHAAIA